jgi:hypothetical protein
MPQWPDCGYVFVRLFSRGHLLMSWCGCREHPRLVIGCQSQLWLLQVDLVDECEWLARYLMYICVICTTNIWTLLRCFFETWAIDVADGDSGWVDNVRGNQEWTNKFETKSNIWRIEMLIGGIVRQAISPTCIRKRREPLFSTDEVSLVKATSLNALFPFTNP